MKKATIDTIVGILLAVLVVLAIFAIVFMKLYKPTADLTAGVASSIAQ